MPTPATTYHVLAWAIENRVRLSCDYGGHEREICPIILGLGRGGDEAVLAWQVGGETSDGPIRGADWKCFRVSRLRHLAIADGEWLAGASHSRRQSCVEDVDYDVNEASPYRPRRSLGGLRGDPA
jgi:hypothetical protein